MKLSEIGSDRLVAVVGAPVRHATPEHNTDKVM